ncbi:MAG: type II toxin-antitoxin system MqsA family antitoxin [Sulfurimicrobium sp.]|nr:type II toxin-antitoxin system MqsA family antitoxin [Sulfurimicrobium sp.]MDP1704383.1 type II toxin-antitoxin system MqsA family antitoxin [Sulfurimicrobium sp.]MDP2198194.1 type II toxin-antitoxin system MqsA family antitoxin [Sulfurimicrobium sp.]
MKCPICKHGSTHAGYASITLERDDATLVFKHVPAEICDNCGEEYVSEEVTGSLLERASRAASEGVRVDVREYRVA